MAIKTKKLLKAVWIGLISLVAIMTILLLIAPLL